METDQSDCWISVNCILKYVVSKGVADNSSDNRDLKQKDAAAKRMW